MTDVFLFDPLETIGSRHQKIAHITYHQEWRGVHVVTLLLLLYVWLARRVELRAVCELQLARYCPDEACCEESLPNCHCLSSRSGMAVLTNQPGHQATAFKSFRIGSEVVSVGLERQACPRLDHPLPKTCQGGRVSQLDSLLRSRTRKSCFFACIFQSSSTIQRC